MFINLLYNLIMNKNHLHFITFIIPTIGRDSLQYSIDSLINQSDNDWKAIIIFDNIKNNIKIIDERIKIIETSIMSLNTENRAGLIRNIGIQSISNKDSEWIGFLDDDDYLSPDYISNLKKEILINDKIEVCIFRMAYKNGYILPSKFDKNIQRGKVGISFAIKQCLNNSLFSNKPYEDYFFLKELQNKKYKIIISSYVTYFIRMNPYNSDEYNKLISDLSNTNFPKIRINF